MNIVLTGFMGTGKSAVGRRLAEDLHVAFVDVDETIEKRAGHSVRNIFEHQGEAAFRILEADVITELSKVDRAVISTGGGALLNPKNQENLSRQGILVCLRAKTSTLLERLKEDVTRPLLTGENVEARMERLLKERQSIYDLCTFQIDTDDKTIAAVATEIIQAISPKWRAA